jgi:heat shock protein HslJ/membrane-bound inhibitor of C-type lysozyme
MSLIRRTHLPITLLCLTLGVWAPTAIAAPADDPDASELICGEQRIRVSYAGDRMRLEVGEQIFDLAQAVSASGARYVALEDPTTSFWGKGDRGILEVRGETYPECIPVETAQPPFRATGNEPFWNIEMDHTRVELIMDLGETRINVALTEPEPVEDGRRYRNLIEDGDLQITILDRLCMDTMSGMPHPKTVEVVLDDLRLRGCGGEPAELLQGQEWVVEDIGGGGIIDRSRVTLNFGTDGRLWGRASCNSYLGGFALTGESLSLSPSATTMMACAPSLMNQETKFLDLLARVQRFEVDRTGVLVLHANDASTLLARRE